MFLDVILTKLIFIIFIITGWSFLVWIILQVKKEEPKNYFDLILNKSIWPIIIFWSILIIIFIILLIRN